MQMSLTKFCSFTLSLVVLFGGGILTANALEITPNPFITNDVNAEFTYSTGASEWGLIWNYSATAGYVVLQIPENSSVTESFTSLADGNVINDGATLKILTFNNETDYNLCSSGWSYAGCIGEVGTLDSVGGTIINFFEAVYIGAESETPTTTPPLTQDNRVFNLMLFTALWLAVFAGTFTLVNKFT